MLLETAQRNASRHPASERYCATKSPEEDGCPIPVAPIPCELTPVNVNLAAVKRNPVAVTITLPDGSSGCFAINNGQKESEMAMLQQLSHTFPFSDYPGVIGEYMIFACAFVGSFWGESI
jgi:hypothetical protein